MATNLEFILILPVTLQAINDLHLTNSLSLYKFSLMHANSAMSEIEMFHSPDHKNNVHNETVAIGTLQPCFIYITCISNYLISK